MTSPHSFPLEFAAHEAGDAVDGVDGLGQDGVDGFADGHFDTGVVGEGDDGGAGGDAFDDGGGAREVAFERFAFAKRFAAGAVAAFGAEARGGEIACAREPEEGFAIGAEGDAQARDLGKASREEGGLGVVAGLQAIEHAGGEGDDVLAGACEFDAQSVVACVDAQVGGAEPVLRRIGEVG